MNATLYLAYILALWAASYVLVFEDGPYCVLARFRSLLGVTTSDQGVRTANTILGKLFNCPKCLSVWLCLPLYFIGIKYTFMLYALGGVGLVITIIELLETLDG